MSEVPPDQKEPKEVEEGAQKGIIFSKIYVFNGDKFRIGRVTKTERYKLLEIKFVSTVVKFLT